MAVKVLVSREFVVSSVADADKKFRALSDAGWGVFVESPRPSEGQSPPTPDRSVGEAARRVDEIIKSQRLSFAAVSRLIGVSQQTVRNWRLGLYCPQIKTWQRLDDLYEKSKKSQLSARDHAIRRVTKKPSKKPRDLSQDEVLDIAISRGKGESVHSLAKRYSISRERVGRILHSLGA